MSTPGSMTIPFWSLFGFIAWTLLLLLAIGGARVVQVLQGEKRPSEFLRACRTAAIATGGSTAPT